MTRNITILTSLEYLGPYVQGGDQFLGLTVQVASSDSFDSQKEYMFFCPWLWTADSGGGAPKPVIVELADASAPSTLPAGGTQATLDAPEPTVQALRDKLVHDCQDACKNNSLSWTNPVGTTQTEKSVDGEALRWPAQLAHLTRLPFPLPHHLHLSYFTTLDGKYVPKSSLAACLTFTVNGYDIAPDFSGGGTLSADPVTGLLTLPCKVLQNGVVATDLAVVFQTKVLRAAECRRASRAVRGGDPIADGDPYVQLPVPEDRAWLSDLLLKSARLFDSASLLVRGLQAVISSTNAPVRQAVLPKSQLLRDVFLQAVFDTSGPGWQNTPGVPDPRDGTQTGASLLDRLYTAWLDESPKAPAHAKFQQDLVAPMRGKTMPPLLWRQTLAKVDPLGWAELNAISNSAIDPTDTQAAGKLVRTFGNLRASWSSQATLKALLFAQWDNLAPAPLLSDFKTFVTSQTDLPSKPVKIDLHELCLLCFLGQSSWGGVLAGRAALQDKMEDRTALRSAIFEQLRKTFAGMLVKAGADDGVKSAFDAVLFTNGNLESSAVRDDLYDLVPSPSQVTAAGAVSTTITKVPEGIHLTVASLASHDTDNQGNYSSDTDQRDPVRDFSGLCVFARRAANDSGKAGKWLCINTAVAVLNGDPKARLTANTVIPVPLHNENGLRVSNINYNNRPLMGRSPDMALGQRTAEPPTPSLVEFFAAPMTGIGGGDIPVLVFGNSYDFIVGLVSNAGALPPGLGDSACPGKLATDTDAAFKNAGLGDWRTFFQNYGCTVLYKRTTQVQELGMSAANQTFKLPTIPMDVFPRAPQEIMPDPGKTASEQMDATPVGEHLLLLGGYDRNRSLRSFSFQLQKPQTDLRTWDAWIARPTLATIRPAAQDRRIKMWGTFHNEADRTISQGSTRLDDPAISRMLLRITPIADTTCQINGKPSMGGPSSVSVVFPVPAVAPVPPNETGPPINVTVQASPVKPNSPGPASITVTVTNANINITAGAGALAKLDFLPIVDDAERCIDAVHPLAEGALALSKGLVLFLETATDALPNSNALEKAASATHQAENGATGLVKFSLRLDQTIDPAFRNVHRTMLKLQSWIWDGRAPHLPFPRDVVAANYPDLTPSGNSAALDAWCKENYYGRDQDSSNSSWMSPDDNGTMVYKEDVSSQPGLLFFNYWVQAYSRYGPLVPPTPALSSTRKQAIVPLRWKGEIPKPAIKAVLPLTSSLDPTDPTASLLIIVQGTWFTLGGLSEVLIAELLQSTDELDQSSHVEAGPDPVRAQPDELTEAYEWPESPGPAPTPSFLQHSLELQGPVGHTRDADAPSGRLWINSSFVLPPVQTNGHDIPWEFAKVRFRRAFAMNGRDMKYYEVSAPSNAFWVQFLPNNDMLQTSTSFVKYDGMQLRIQNKKANLVQGGVSVKLPDRAVPSATSGTVIIPYLLLTKALLDQQSNKEGEYFVGIFVPNGSGWDLSSLDLSIESPDWARIISIETRDLIPQSTDKLNPELWDAVFPQDPKQDALARIVSISQQIKIAN